MFETQERFGAMKVEKKSTYVSNVIFLALCAIIIFGFGSAIFILPQQQVSEEENRSLATFPNFSLEELADGSFTSDIADFYADQFPLRNNFVAFKAICELSLLKQENNDVIIGSNGYLIPRLEYSESALAKFNTNLDALSELQRSAPFDLNIYIAPRSVDVNTSHLPVTFDPSRSAAVWDILDSKNINYTDGRQTLRDLSSDGQYVWYKTDHHWTTLGAYHAYRDISALLSYTPSSPATFSKEKVSESFLGTAYSSSGIRWASPDTMEYFRFDGDDSFKTEIYSSSMKPLSSFDGFYDRSYLDTKDKYASFLSSNNAVTKVYDDSSDKPCLLIVKDSFANSVVPFLAQHYDLIILDMREYQSTISDFVSKNDIDDILILCGIDTLTSYDFRLILQ